MVLVRESPRAKVSPDKNNQQWPPKSPFQALLSSPSGRKKWQDRQSRTRERSSSPSPVKRSLSGVRGLEMPDTAEDVDMDGEEEDEEMLQLRLEAIQAKLKLKALQKKRQTGQREGTASRADSWATSPGRTSTATTSRPRQDIQVPLSPTKPQLPLKEHPSPARARLGLPPTIKADGVSLKRARDGTHIKRSDTALSSRRTDENVNAPKSVSFSERLARSKTDAQDHQARQERIERSRSNGFGLDSSTQHPSTLNGRATPKFSNPMERPSSAGHLQASRVDRSAAVARSASTRTARSKRAEVPHASGLFATAASEDSAAQTNRAETGEQDGPASGYDAFSSLHLSKREIAHSVVAREMAGKEVYTLPRLLKEVTAPHYDPPDCESDFVVFAVLASKSKPFDKKANHRTSDENNPQEDADAPRNKFMVLHLCDLKWEIDCFLFGTAFDQFWKLTPGTLLAILNPSIMPPKGNKDTGTFSLKLGSSDDAVMEIGIARDLGYCVSVKKDGQPCGQWVDKRHTEICDFHLNLLIDRNRKDRMEVNSMWRGEKNKDPNDRWDRESKRRSRAVRPDEDASKVKKSNQGNFHHEYGRLYSVPSGYAKSAASLLDADDTDALHNMTQEEASRKRIASAQRERDLARRLGEMGNGAGAEYLRATTKATDDRDPTITNSADSNGKPYFDKPSAADLGLLNNRATTTRLSPAKDRKRHFGLGAMSMHTGGSAAMGWGGATKAGLLLPKQSQQERVGSPERGQTRLEISSSIRRGIVRERSQDGSGSVSPKKRARFMLEKGIREPGRESLGAVAVQLGGGAGDGGEGSEDELDIV